ncbi:MAG: glycosyltransferase [Candidatus Dadabacteria bacterium]|nr:glycosyltransferase [Candidatus Dadabacteria bacterium]NIT13630.1 glycosyltransferase [Candidatus Dadabacteria bacterium]
MDFRTKILFFLYKYMPFDLKGDARSINTSKKFSISCIINFYRRTDLLRNILTCLSEQDFDKRDFEVVLVEDRGGTDEGSGLIKEFKTVLNINYIRLDKNYGRMGYSRNVGVSNAKGKYVLLLDDDTVILQKDFLSRLYKEFNEYGADGIIPKGFSSYCLVEGKYEHHDLYFPASKCTAYDKRVLKELGGFVDEIIGQEDVEFYMRFSLAGKHFYKSGSLEYFHPPFIFNNINKAAAVGSSYTNIRYRYPIVIWLLLVFNGLRYLPKIIFPMSKKIRMEITFSTGFLYGIYCCVAGKDIGYS